jgi:uncharacterized cupin superfamily protein
MAKTDVQPLKSRVGSSYPAPYDEPCRSRENKRLGDAAGLTTSAKTAVATDRD